MFFFFFYSVHVHVSSPRSYLDLILFAFCWDAVCGRGMVLASAVLHVVVCGAVAYGICSVRGYTSARAICGNMRTVKFLIIFY